MSSAKDIKTLYLGDIFSQSKIELLLSKSLGTSFKISDLNDFHSPQHGRLDHIHFAKPLSLCALKSFE